MANDTHTPDPNLWTPELVRDFCASAPRLEMWTIPLYLCVAYSIKNVQTDPKTGLPTFSPVDYPVAKDGEPIYSWFKDKPDQASQFAFNSILSVAIQEMLHVELSANLCNAISGVVDFTGTDGSLAPIYDADHVPCVEVPPDLRKLVKLGPLNKDAIELLKWIEHPLPPNPDPPLNPNPETKYRSIGEFYYALQHGIETQWANLYPQTGDPQPDDLKQKDDFQQRLNKLYQKLKLLLRADYSFSVEIYGQSADAEKKADSAIEAIVDQGEGTSSDSHKQVNPAFVPTGDPAVEVSLDKWTHWERFDQISKVMDEVAIETYEVIDNPTPAQKTLQDALKRVLELTMSSFLDSLNQGFGSKDALDLDSMAGIGNRIVEVWQAGALPDFTYVVYEPPQYPHACQGLNACAGQGVGGSGTVAGDGYCATAWYHSCGQTNKCKGQGGCGYAVDRQHPDDFDVNWLPNENQCNAKGGCGAPIPVLQKFNTQTKYPPIAPEKYPDGDPCGGADVWDRARKLLAEKVGHELPAVTPNELRTALKPTAQ
jgi:hypothetical protein